MKLECNHFGNSFKARGICNFLNYVNKTKGLVTFTTGNHGISIAAIAKELNIPAIIVSTNKLNPYKRELIKNYGAIIHQLDNCNLTSATEFAQQIANKKGFTFVPLYDNEFLLDGYSQIAKEIIEDFDSDLSVYFPIGSGSLLLANSKVLKKFDKNIKTIGVEPKVYQRLNGSNVCNVPSTSIADCLSIDRLPSSNLELIKFVDEILAIDENEIVQAMKLIRSQFDLMIEPGGAITLAAALRTESDSINKIAVVTGKNISTEKFNLLIQ